MHLLQVAEIVELPNPDTTPAAERRELRLLAEDARFDPEHYMYGLDAHRLWSK